MYVDTAEGTQAVNQPSSWRHQDDASPVASSLRHPDNYMHGATVLPFTGSQAETQDTAASTWHYKQPPVGSRRFSGEVIPISGGEGARRRGEIAAVIRDLLRWADQRRNQISQPEEQDGERAA
ncbi:hypothetical protein [Allokutzneria sp. NRRL B-24872]|uniref:hypothetical protein n=1 Tax=Allokutzneria sp. NRRL B-24872 TaxID=1137961 RepID=UPI0011786906|nr:hypothetical protein [Allokutzneria sp. NRRL B-24872]